MRLTISRARRSSAPPQLRRIAVVVLVLAAAGAAAGGLWGERRAQVHEAVALILVNPTEGNPFSPGGSVGANLVNLETEAQLVVSDEVAQLVMERIDLDSTDAALAGVDAAVPSNTQLIEITAGAASTTAALERAQAFAEVFLEYRRDRTEVAVFDRGAAIKEQIAEQTGELDDQVLLLASRRRDSPQALLLQQQIAEVNSHLGQLRSEVAGLDVAPVDPGQVVTPATVGGTGPLGLREMGALAGLVAGGGLGLAWGVSRVRLAGWVRGPEDLPDGAPPLLGVIQGAEATAAELAGLRAGVLGLTSRRPFIAVTASLEGRPVTSAVLAASLARANLEVILVDACSAEVAATSAGLADLLRLSADADEVLRSVRQHLMFLPPGTDAEDLEDLVVAPQMSDLLEDLAKRADVVLIACPDVSHAQTQTLARSADAVVLEVVRGHSTGAQVTAAQSRLVGTTEATQTGLVLVHPDATWRSQP